jgi:hypothetical protein
MDDAKFDDDFGDKQWKRQYDDDIRNDNNRRTIRHRCQKRWRHLTRRQRRARPDPESQSSSSSAFIREPIPDLIT